jgi:DNA-binding NtrC family response regulator
MKYTFTQIEKVEDININVFINGESGISKELDTRTIHFNSSYRNKKFVDINFGAIPEELQESEFFGHEKGAFTDAESPRIGKLEVADGGTLFLDELAELSPKAQVKLLRFLQDKSFERVAGNKKIKVDLRIISATNNDLEKAVANGELPEDLYCRLVVYPIFIPQLWDRNKDIPPLVNHFIKNIGTKF